MRLLEKRDQLMARPAQILRTVMAAAIHERRILSLTYAGAVQPQLFVPAALYLSAANRLMVDGCELHRRRPRWRELDLEAVRDVRQTADTCIAIDTDMPIRKSYPKGATVIAQAPGLR
jgi:hypothetical protein